ncbi:hypothetical protein EDB85DRAFT_1887238 [Lactarius pseudohatsudake]|nr:hypothetical protein EDB85DRAFT_1887238 [Lactarius pseudohatsudake]
MALIGPEVEPMSQILDYASGPRLVDHNQVTGRCPVTTTTSPSDPSSDLLRTLVLGLAPMVKETIRGTHLNNLKGLNDLDLGRASNTKEALRDTGSLFRVAFCGHERRGGTRILRNEERGASSFQLQSPFPPSLHLDEFTVGSEDATPPLSVPHGPEDVVVDAAVNWKAAALILHTLNEYHGQRQSRTQPSTTARTAVPVRRYGIPGEHTYPVMGEPVRDEKARRRRLHGRFLGSSAGYFSRWLGPINVWPCQTQVIKTLHMVVKPVTILESYDADATPDQLYHNGH